MYLCTNLKLTVWHNWFNWVHSAWSCKTYKQFVANFRATTGVIYIRSFPNFFRPSSSSCRANGANIALSSWFLYLAYIVWLFDPLFLLVCFSGLYIYILARQFSIWACKMRHNAWQSETTVEPRCNDMPREQWNWIVISRYRYIETPDITILS